MSGFFRVQLGVVSRSEGHCAAKRAAYQSCGRIVGHEGTVFDFGRKAAEHVGTIMLAPGGAPPWTRDPAALWQRAAQAEKRLDAQEARIVDFSMPRAIPPHLWDACIRHVYAGFVLMGMVLQIDIHDTPASDGGRNVNVHGMVTLRQIDGEGFAARKNRAWNDFFRERSGRTVREQFAERLTGFCRAHGLDYEGDARPNAERDRPAPEPELPKWNFEAVRRGDDVPEALTALQQHRNRRRQWEKAREEQDAAELDLAKLEAELRRRRSRRIGPAAPGQRPRNDRDRRAAILRAWHDTDWIDVATVAAIASTRYDDRRDCLWIDLRDGSTLIDQGDCITLLGKLTWSAAMETVAAAERHGWTEVDVHGDEAYKDMVTMAAMLRGIPVTNHTLSYAAQRRFEQVRAAQAARSTAVESQKESPEESRNSNPRPEVCFRGRSSRDILVEIARRAAALGVPETAAQDGQPPAPVLRPRTRAT